MLRFILNTLKNFTKHCSLPASYNNIVVLIKVIHNLFKSCYNVWQEADH